MDIVEINVEDDEDDEDTDDDDNNNNKRLLSWYNSRNEILSPVKL